MRIQLAIAAINGFLAVVAGAFAAHCLKGMNADAASVFETATRYHMYHALAMGLAVFAMRGAAARAATISAALFLAGIVLFSGSLYLLALTAAHALVFVTPFGGIAYMLGWIALAIAALRLAPP